MGRGRGAEGGNPWWPWRCRRRARPTASSRSPRTCSGQRARRPAWTARTWLLTLSQIKNDTSQLEEDFEMRIDCEDATFANLLLATAPPPRTSRFVVRPTKGRLLRIVICDNSNCDKRTATRELHYSAAHLYSQFQGSMIKDCLRGKTGSRTEIQEMNGQSRLGLERPPDSRGRMQARRRGRPRSGGTTATAVNNWITQGQEPRRRRLVRPWRWKLVLYFASGLIAYRN